MIIEGSTGPTDECMFLGDLIEGIEEGFIYPWKFYEDGDKERTISHAAFHALGEVLGKLSKKDECYRKYLKNLENDKVEDGKRAVYEYEYARFVEEGKEAVAEKEDNKEEELVAEMPAQNTPLVLDVADRKRKGPPQYQGRHKRPSWCRAPQVPPKKVGQRRGAVITPYDESNSPSKKLD